MTAFDFIVDDPSTRIHALLREFGLCLDFGFRGEIMRLLEVPGFRRAYFRKRGLTVDGLAEMLWDRRITGRRLSTAEVIDVLDLVLVVAGPRPRRRRRVEAVTEIEREAERAAKNRQRKFACPVCNQIARATRAADLLCGKCYSNDGAIVSMRRVEPLPEEILIAVSEAA